MRKLMWFSIGFCIASAIGSYVLSMKWYLLASGVCAVALGVFLAWMMRFPKLRLCAMVLFGCIAGFCYQAGYDVAYLSTARAADELTLQTTIYATDYSYDTDYGCSVEGIVELSGKTYQVKVYLPADTSLQPGQWLSGKFLFRGTLPGASRESAYYTSRSMFLLAYPQEMTIGTPDRMPLYAYPAYIHDYISGMIGHLFPKDTAAFAKALLLGDTDDLTYETDTDLKSSGIRHVVAVSGLHVTILFSLVYVITGRRKWLNALLGLPVLFLFAAVAGFSPSITRACIMHALVVIAMLFEREYDPPTALSFAVLVMLLGNPGTFTDVGFQLSVGCMAGIILFAEPIKNWLLEKQRLGRFKGRIGKVASHIASGAAVSIGAGIVTTPLCAWYFGMVSLVGILTNLLTLWVISFIFYGIILVCCVALIHAPLASAIAWVVAWPIRYVLNVATILADFPLAAVYTASIYIVMWLVLCYGMLAAFACMTRKRPLVFSCCAAISLCIALLASWTEPLADECRITVLDVGQGQCILLQSDGKNYLVDCGGTDDETAAYKAAALLCSQGISRLDGLIITHYDRDHAAGASYLLSRISADCLYLPNCADEDGTADSLYASGSPIFSVDRDTSITFADTRITLIPSRSDLTSNESGLCILFQTENCDILITGDRNADGERELLEHMTLPELEVLIVGHHGSKYSTSPELLAQTTPEYAIISVGENHYGHPTQEVLQRLQACGCIVYRTDHNGTIIYRR